jgi:hypothetical protein
MGLGTHGCDPNELHSRRTPDGCKVDEVYCRTPAPVEALQVAVGATVPVQLTTVGRAFIEELRVIAAGGNADFQITQIQIAGRNFLTDGPIAALAFGRDWPAGSQLLPTDMEITASVPATFQITNRGTVIADFIAVAILKEARL